MMGSIQQDRGVLADVSCQGAEVDCLISSLASALAKIHEGPHCIWTRGCVIKNLAQGASQEVHKMADRGVVSPLPSRPGLCLTSEISDYVGYLSPLGGRAAQCAVSAASQNVSHTAPGRAGSFRPFWKTAPVWTDEETGEGWTTRAEAEAEPESTTGEGAGDDMGTCTKEPRESMWARSCCIAALIYFTWLLMEDWKPSW